MHETVSILIGGLKLSERYRNCLLKTVERLLVFSAQIECIFLHAGLTRDECDVVGWSDIDLVLILRSSNNDLFLSLAQIVCDMKREFGIRIEMKPYPLCCITNGNRLKNIYEGKILNILSRKEDVGLTLYGALPDVNIDFMQERKAARFYIDSIEYRLRYDMCNCTNRDNETVRKLIKFISTYSLVALRMVGTNADKYEDANEKLHKAFPKIDMSIVDYLTQLRYEFGEKQFSEPDVNALINRVFDFIACIGETLYEEGEEW